MLLIVGIGVAIWYLSRKEPAAVAPPPRAVGTLTQEEQIADSLARGQMAIATDRLTDPRGNNAVEYFRAVLALQPDNADARTGLEAVGARLEARVVEALQAHDPARGATALMVLQRAVPEYPRLDALRAELVALSRSTRAPVSVAPPPAPVKQPAARASRTSREIAGAGADTADRSQPQRPRRRRSPAQASSIPSRDCAVEAFCSNRRATMPTSNCSRCAPSIRRRTSFASSSSSSRSRSWNGRALRSRPATWKRHAHS